MDAPGRSSSGTSPGRYMCVNRGARLRQPTGGWGRREAPSEIDWGLQLVGHSHPSEVAGPDQQEGLDRQIRASRFASDPANLKK